MRALLSTCALVGIAAPLAAVRGKAVVRVRLRHKYNAVRTAVAGRSYASKAEAAYAAQLHTRKAAGDILGWLEQVPMHLPGGVRYVLDFLVFTSTGEVIPVEVKGMETPAYKIKRALIAEHYPWMPVEVVSKGKPRKGAAC